MASGSSPLARGLPTRRPFGPSECGIIPARAGFTRRWTTWPTTRADHPRSRGVYARPTQPTVDPAGSSPLARGLRPAQFYRAAHRGDHPRSRGVYGGSRPDASKPLGSSPLARGLPGRDLGRVGRRRIIPARAGFTGRGRWTGRSVSDHPRSRGVYVIGSLNANDIKGSSPLARGLRHEGLLLMLAAGIIPARAGFTRNCRWTPLPSGDHPRSRGVYIGGRAVLLQAVGSSPLARGLHRHPSLR